MSKFFESLTMSNKDIKNSRAESLAEITGVEYKRHVEDLELELKKLIRQKLNMLDLAPDNTTTLKVTNDFEPNKWVLQHSQLAIKIKQMQLQIEVVKQEYDELFSDI